MICFQVARLRSYQNCDLSQSEIRESEGVTRLLPVGV